MGDNGGKWSRRHCDVTTLAHDIRHVGGTMFYVLYDRR